MSPSRTETTWLEKIGANTADEKRENHRRWEADMPTRHVFSVEMLMNQMCFIAALIWLEVTNSVELAVAQEEFEVARKSSCLFVPQLS